MLDLNKFMKAFYIIGATLFSIGVITNVYITSFAWPAMRLLAKVNWVCTSFFFQILIIVMFGYMYTNIRLQEKATPNITEEDVESFKKKLGETTDANQKI
jgi:carbon starvation protein CstA